MPGKAETHFRISSEISRNSYYVKRCLLGENFDRKKTRCEERQTDSFLITDVSDVLKSLLNRIISNSIYRFFFDMKIESLHFKFESVREKLVKIH